VKSRKYESPNHRKNSILEKIHIKLFILRGAGVKLQHLPLTKMTTKELIGVHGTLCSLCDENGLERG
jgi:hypothetical protein